MLAFRKIFFRWLLVIYWSFQVNPGFAQRLIEIFPGYIFQDRLNTITCSFSQVHFNHWGQINVSVTYKDGTGIPFNSAVEVTNDSTLLIRLKASSNQIFADSLRMIIRGVDENLKYKDIVEFPIRAAYFKGQQEISPKLGSQYFNWDSLGNWVRITMAGRGTHFLDPETKFGLELTAFGNQNLLFIDSVELVNDSLAYLYFPKPTHRGLTQYQFRYGNLRDGIHRNFAHCVIRTGTIWDYLGVNIGDMYFKGEILTNTDTLIQVEVIFTENDSLHPDTLLVDPAPFLRWMKTGQDSVVGICSAFQFKLDTIFGEEKNFQRLTYTFEIHLKVTDPEGRYDLVFSHSQLEPLRVPDAIQLRRNFSNWQFYGSAYPGRRFILEMNSYNYFKLGMQVNAVNFFQNSAPTSVFKVDSIVKSTYGWKLFGYADTLAIGRFDAKIGFGAGLEQTCFGAITVSNRFPLLLKLEPNHIIPGAQSNSGLLSSHYISGIALAKGIPQMKFLRNNVETNQFQMETDVWGGSYVITHADSNTSPGWYDVNVFDILNGRWYLQPNFIYVYGNARAIKISPDRFVRHGAGPALRTVWFTGTHFTKAQESWVSNGSKLEVLSDTMVRFRSANGDLEFYNDLDGFIPAVFVMKEQDAPLFRVFTPNWIAQGATQEFIIGSDLTTWTLEPIDVDVSFWREEFFEPRFMVQNILVENDTTLRVTLYADSTIQSRWYELRVFQRNDPFLMRIPFALNVVPTSLNKFSISGPSGIKLYPNPGFGNLTLEADPGIFDQLEFYSAQGKSLGKIPIESWKTQIKADELFPVPGIYLLRLSGASTQVIRWVRE